MRILVIILLSLSLTSCAAIFGSKYQQIEIKSGRGGKVLVDGEVPEKKNGKYLVRRNKEAKQITIEREDYHDENYVIMQYKRNALGYTSSPWVLLFYVNPDSGAKAFNYPDKVKTGRGIKLFDYGTKDKKNLRINKTSVDVKAEDIRSLYFRSYGQYLRREGDKKSEAANDAEDINIDNTIFSETLNKILVDRGFIDTTGRAITANYLNDMYVNASVKSVTINGVGNRFSGNWGMVYIGMEIDWKILDFYRKPITEFSTKTTSGQFKARSYADAFVKSSKDAIERGFIELMNKDEVSKLIRIDKNVQPETLPDIAMSKAEAYVSSPQDAIISSVTIKHRQGHGSGFVIGADGYIITNYHVISELDDSKVVMGDGTEYSFEVVRENKVYDLALLKIDAQGLVPFQIREDRNIEIASDIYVIGTPTAQDLSQTVSRGIISGLRPSVRNSKLIQTDASVNAGNSGGAIINKDGALIGVVSSKLRGYGIEGVGFGIPAYEIIDQLRLKQE